MNNNLKINVANEQIKRALLMMKYDSSKTLTENEEKIINVLTEETCPNQISDSEIKTLTNEMGDAIKKMNTAFMRMGYIEERAKIVYDVISKLSTKNFYNNIKKTCVNSLFRLEEHFRTEYRDWWSEGDPLEEELEDLITGYIGDNDATAKDYLEEALRILRKSKTNNGGEETTTTTTTTRTSQPEKSKYTYCPDFPFTKFCKNNKIRKIQECVGAKVDGAYGPETERKLKENGYDTTITEEIYNRIITNCGGGNKEGGGNEEGGEVNIEDGGLEAIDANDDF